MNIEFSHPSFLEISQHVVSEFNKEKNEAFFLAGTDKNTSHLLKALVKNKKNKQLINFHYELRTYDKNNKLLDIVKNGVLDTDEIQPKDEVSIILPIEYNVDINKYEVKVMAEITYKYVSIFLLSTLFILAIYIIIMTPKN